MTALFNHIFFYLNKDILEDFGRVDKDSSLPPEQLDADELVEQLGVLTFSNLKYFKFNKNSK